MTILYFPINFMNKIINLFSKKKKEKFDIKETSAPSGVAVNESNSHTGTTLSISESKHTTVNVTKQLNDVIEINTKDDNLKTGPYYNKYIKLIETLQPTPFLLQQIKNKEIGFDDSSINNLLDDLEKLFNLSIAKIENKQTTISTEIKFTNEMMKLMDTYIKEKIDSKYRLNSPLINNKQYYTVDNSALQLCEKEVDDLEKLINSMENDFNELEALYNIK